MYGIVWLTQSIRRNLGETCMFSTCKLAWLWWLTMPLSYNTTTSNTTSTTADHTSLRLAVDIVIAVFAVTGNFVVLRLLCLQNKPKTHFEWFIGNLAVVDLIFQLGYLLTEHYNVPFTTFCKIFFPIPSIFLVISMYTIVAIAIYRYKSVVHSLTFKPSKRYIHCTIGGLWLFSCIVFIPLYVVFHYNENTRQCYEYWSMPVLNKIYTIALFLAQYPIPLSIIIVCYTKIVVFLKHHRIAQNSIGTCGNQLQQAIKRKQDKEILHISVIIVLLYTILTLPLQVAWLSSIVFDSTTVSKYTFLFSSQLLSLHSCCNPIVYGVISKSFRAQFISYARSTCCCYRKTRTLTSVQGHDNTSVLSFHIEKRNCTLGTRTL